MTLPAKEQLARLNYPYQRQHSAGPDDVARVDKVLLMFALAESEGRAIDLQPLCTLVLKNEVAPVNLIVLVSPHTDVNANDPALSGQYHKLDLPLA